MNELISEEDVIKALKQRGQSIIKNVVDLNFVDIITKYVKNGGYNMKKSLEENFSLLIKVVATQKAMGKI